MKTLKVGLIQQANTADVKANLLTLAQNIEDVVKKGAELVVLQELHNSLYFCQTEDTSQFDLAEPIPGPSTGFLANWLGNIISYWLHPYSKNGLPASITTRQWYSKKTVQ